MCTAAPSSPGDLLIALFVRLVYVLLITQNRSNPTEITAVELGHRSHRSGAPLTVWPV